MAYTRKNPSLANRYPDDELFAAFDTGIGDAHDLIANTVDTKAQLKALSTTGIANGEVRHVLGEVAAGDGVHSHYRADTTAAKSFTVDSTNATNNTIAIASHGYTTGQPLVFYGGALPSGITAGIIYYAAVITTNNFKLVAVQRDALAATPTVVDIGTGSGSVNIAGNDGTVVIPDANPPSFRWLEVGDTYLHAKKFGVTGDVNVDQTAAFRNAVAASLNPAANWRAKRILVLPPGDIRLTDTVRIVASGLVMEGAGATDSGSGGTRFMWAGASDRPAFEWHLRSTSFRNFMVFPLTACLAGARIARWDENNSSWVPSRAYFENISFASSSGVAPFFTYCVDITADGTGMVDNNNENITFVNCEMLKFTEAGVRMRQYSQAHAIRFFFCNINASESNGNYCIKQESGASNGGFFYAYMCGGGYAQQADFQIATGNSHIKIEEWNSEQSVRLLKGETTATNNYPWPVTISGGRFETDFLHTDGYYIDYRFSGPLRVEGLHTRFGTTYRPQIRLATVATFDGTLIHQNNTYMHGNLDQAAVISNQGGTWKIFDQGNLWFNQSTGGSRLITSQSN